jgi:hypothetical protein
VWNTVVQKVILGKTRLYAITGRLYNFSADIQRSLQQLSSVQHRGILLKMVCLKKAAGHKDMSPIAQINFEDLTPYLTHGKSLFSYINSCQLVSLVKACPT